MVEAVSRMLERYEFYPVRQRTMQENLKFMQSDEGYRAKLVKRYGSHMKNYTY